MGLLEGLGALVLAGIGFLLTIMIGGAILKALLGFAAFALIVIFVVWVFSLF
ncbi:MAG: hypothetical protein MJZ37_04660 [Bacilli bacterium]|nr:hypothetical protein [Bacilli bacterium]